VKSRFWTTFVAPKVAKGANARNGQRGMKYFVVLKLLSVKIGAFFV
jgi:hypothetical protein